MNPQKTTALKSDENTDFYALLISSALIGFLVGVAVSIFLRVLNWTIEFVWKGVPYWIGPIGQTPLYPLMVCTLGGLLVGLCQKYFGDYPPSLHDSLANFRRTGRIEYVHLPHGVVNALVSLVFGGSLGPEAVLTNIIGGLATWFGDIRTKHGYVRRAITYAAISGGFAFFGSPVSGAVLPIESPQGKTLSWLKKSLPGFIGAITGFGGFLWIAGDNAGDLFKLSVQISQQLINLVWAIPAALAGAALGTAYYFLSKVCKAGLTPLFKRPILKGLAGGAALGLIGTFLPLTLFSGEHEILNLAGNGAEMGFTLLFLTGLGKVLATTLCLAAGWKGGNIFPLIYSGASFGLALTILFPVIPPLVGMISGMAATTVVILRQPIAVIILLLGFLRGGAAGVIVVATLVAYMVTRPLFPVKQDDKTEEPETTTPVNNAAN